ncbi:MAG: helix-turn-helix domain-containing protein [Brevefilum sp.]
MELTIGAQLKQVRESRGISLEAIAHKTHISLAYLQALEENDVESLPSKVHLRGFLRLYANELGVDLDDLTVSDYHLAVKPHTTPANQAIDAPQEPQPSPDDELQDATEQETPVEGDIEPAEESEEDQISPPPKVPAPHPVSEPSEPEGSAQMFAAIGEKIKNRRDLLSISIDEVHNTIHIAPPYLLAIESGKFDQLPSPVHAKGMLVNYANFLNLETEPILSTYTDALQLQRLEKQTAPEQRGRRAARELSPTALRLKNFFTLDLLVITTLFVVIAVFVIWGVNRILASDPPDTPESDIPGVSDVLLAEDTPTPDLTSIAEITEVDEAQEVESELEAEEEPLFTPVISSDPINILLIPRQRLWAQVTVDGDLVFQGRLIPGNAYDFSAEEQIDLLTGNIGALQILFNNQDIGSQGVLGQVADLSFTVNGLVLPPPTSTPTITVTPSPTPTPLESND